MACNGCGEAPAMTKEQVENLIQSKIDDGKIQGGLLSCGGEKLPAQSQVLLCSQLAEKVKELIKDGTVDVVSDITIEDGEWVVTDGTGKQVKTDLPGLKSVEVRGGKLVVTPINGSVVETKLDFAENLALDPNANKLSWKEGGEDKTAILPYLKGVATDKALIATLPDGSTVELPKAGSTLTEDSFDDTIEKGANKTDKFGVKLKDKGGLGRTLDGIEVKLGNGLRSNSEGSLEINPTAIANPDFLQALKDNGLLGKGLRSNSEGALEINPTTIANPDFLQALKDNGLLGKGLDVVDGKLVVKTTRIVDASGTVEVTLGVNK